ncbi:uncharacterized protein ISCGN_007339 [Ixodes scapularis]
MCSSRPEVPGVGPSDFDPVTFLQASLFVSKMFLLRLRLRTLGLCLRKNITHPAIHQVFGFSSSRWAANYRVMQIARQEVSQEILVMQRSLPCLMTSIFGTNFATHPSYVFLSKSAHLLLESSWKLIISSATAEKRVNQSPALEPPLNLSDTTLSAHAESVLSRGPKFAPAYEPSRIDQLAAVHQVASKIPEPERQDFLATGSRVVCRYGRAPPSKLDFLEVVDELRRSELKLLEADKTELFFSPERLYREHRDAFELPEEIFRKQYRLPKIVVRWLCDELREEPEVRRVRTSWTVMTVELQVLCALRFYGTGSFQGMVASDEHVARDQKTVSVAVRAVSVAIVRRLGVQRGWIHFLETPSERFDAEKGFRLLGRIPGVIGCVDGTMVSIVGPSKNDPTVTKAAYWCRKYFYALNVMVVSTLMLRCQNAPQICRKKKKKRIADTV